jgi:hypothetical protein
MPEAGLRSSSRSCRSCTKSAGSSPAITTVSAVSPCLHEFSRERSLPKEVLGPVLLRALFLLASSCLFVWCLRIANRPRRVRHRSSGNSTKNAEARSGGLTAAVNCGQATLSNTLPGVRAWCRRAPWVLRKYWVRPEASVWVAPRELSAWRCASSRRGVAGPSSKDSRPSPL